MRGSVRLEVAGALVRQRIWTGSSSVLTVQLSWSVCSGSPLEISGWVSSVSGRPPSDQPESPESGAGG
eukprot:5159748-Pyramimonas_sp.AAC.1